MARKTARVTISQEGRDFGKVFLLTEFPAVRIERWATRALFALTNAGAELPDDIEGAGMAGLAAMGLEALQRLSFPEAEPLLQEMLECVQFCPDPKNPDVIRFVDWENDIEEVSTIFVLRKEIFVLHAGFFLKEDPSKLLSPTQQSSEGLRITRTSPAPSASS
jgi:hypothetical protein